MKLYLVQHAQPKRKEEDPSRPLSDKGMKHARNMANYAEKHLRVKVDLIVHSGKLRAKQTGEVFADQLNPEKGVIADENLAPLADPRVWSKRLAETTEDVMLVGHLPNLSKLAGHLLVDDESKDMISFKMGGIVCLERDGNGGWTIQWIITPETIT